MINPLKISVLASVIMFLLMIIVAMNTQLQYDSMLLGMGLGISASPLMTYAIKRWKTKRKVDKMIRELRVLLNTRKENEKIESETNSNDFA